MASIRVAIAFKRGCNKICSWFTLSMMAAVVSISYTQNSTLAGVIVSSPELPTHGLVVANTLYGYAQLPSILPGSYVSIEGNGPLLTGQLSDLSNGNGTYTGMAISAVNPYEDSLLKASSSGYGTATGIYSPSGSAYGIAAWRDVAFVQGNNHPAEITLTFAVNGILSTQAFNPDITSDVAGILVSESTTPQSFFSNGITTNTAYSQLYLDTHAYTPYGNQLSTDFISQPGFWDSLAAAGSATTGVSVSGTFHFNVPYDSTLNGYGWGVSVESFIQGFGGSASSNFFDTATLQSVTTVDGTPLNVSFDSGLQPSAVPEPTSLALAAFGGIGLIGNAVRRRRAAVV